MTGPSALPIDAVLPQVTAALERHGACVLTAPPGAGKSTRVPPLVLRGVSGQVQVLQPRRVAAMAVAARIAAEQGWRLGQEIGHRVRFDVCGGPRTRLWVQTEGTLTRQLLRDPYLEGVDALIIDEFHERSWHADLALAWAATLRATVRPDLRLVVMSATMAAEPVAAHLGGVPVISTPEAPHRLIRCHRPAKPRERLAEHVARVWAEAADHDGDALVFLPGVGEIAACHRALADHDAEILELHGGQTAQDQQRIFAPATRRRIILATNVAETSLTVPGVAQVIDSGLVRVARYQAERGIDELRLEETGAFAATQRAGRAARTGDGRCWCLWPAAREQRWAASLAGELHRCDPAPMVLALKALHGPDLASFAWFEPPEADRLAQTEDLLVDLGLVDGQRRDLTDDGRLASSLPLHPRLARLAIDAARAGALNLGAAVSALLAEPDLRRGWRPGQDPVPPGSADLLDRLDLLHGGHGAGPARHRIAAAARQIGDQIAALVPGPDRPAAAAELLPGLLLAAYPDRVAVRDANAPNRLRMVGGAAVQIDGGSALHVTGQRPCARLVVAHAVQGFGGKSSRRQLLRWGCEIDQELLADAIEEAVEVVYDVAADRVKGSRVRRYRDLVIDYASGVALDDQIAAACLATALDGDWAALIATQPRAGTLLARWCWAAERCPEQITPLPEPRRRAVLERWCRGRRSRAEVQRHDPVDWLQSELWTCGGQHLDRLAPADLALPGGRRVAIDYSGQRPLVRVRIQQVFDLGQVPALADGRERLLFHLLAPNNRPVQITDDLPGFWRGSYQQVRKDLRGRYPKHAWPEQVGGG